jgi:hypothetical protein
MNFKTLKCTLFMMVLFVCSCSTEEPANEIILNSKTVEIDSQNKTDSNSLTRKAPPPPSLKAGEVADIDGGGTSPEPLNEVVIINNYSGGNGGSIAAYYSAGGSDFSRITGSSDISYSSGGGVTLVMPLPPEISIADIKKFLSCLNASANAYLTVYAESINIADKNVGHAFISISQGNNTMVFGYYPKNGNLKSLTGPGIMGENGEHRYDVSANMGQISPQQLQKIISLSVDYQNSYYDLGTNNCSDFATDVLNIAGVSTSGWIDTPNTVAAILSALPNHTSKSNYAPKTQRTCP